jgi:hypothetical protein
MPIAETNNRAATRESREPGPHPVEPGIKVVESYQELRSYVDSWTRLASVALEPNVFYEPWMLLPALDLLPESRDVIFVLVFGRSDPSGQVALTGFFPIFIRKLPYHIPISIITTWIHKYCFLSVPLLHRECAHQTLATFLDWLSASPYRGRIFDLRLVPGDGPFQSLLAELLTSRQQRNLIIRSFPRALLRPMETIHEYLDRAITGKFRRELRSKNRQLSQLGQCSCVVVKSPAELDQWIQDFLQIEALGWKGNEGVSFSYDPAGREFLSRVLRNGFAEATAILSALTINDHPIAMQCNLLTSGGGFGFVMTYDENYAKYSPGTLLTLENTTLFHQNPSLRWIDSCAQCDHPMINKLWVGRRMVQRIIVSDGTAFGDFLIAASPLFRHIRDHLRKRLKALLVRIRAKR